MRLLFLLLLLSLGLLGILSDDLLLNDLALQLAKLLQLGLLMRGHNRIHFCQVVGLISQEESFERLTLVRLCVIWLSKVDHFVENVALVVLTLLLLKLFNVLVQAAQTHVVP